MAGKAQEAPSVGHRAYKFRLDPNQLQLVQLYQAAGAARYTYNMMTAYNRAVHRHRDAYWSQRKESGVAEDVIRGELKDLAAKNLQYNPIYSEQSFSTKKLTPEKKRHKTVEKQIAAGISADKAWGEEKHPNNPWLHHAKQRVLASGLKNAGAAWKNYWDSATGKRAGGKVGLPRFKKKGVSRDSFTIDIPYGKKGTPEENTPKDQTGGYGVPYLQKEPAYKRLKRKGAKPVIGDYRHVRLTFLGVIRTFDSTKPLVKAVRAGAKIKSYTVSRNADRWYVSFLVELSKPIFRPATKRQRASGAVGVDLGVKYLATLSDPDFKSSHTEQESSHIENKRFTQDASKKLKKLQRRLARSKKNSKRRTNLVQRIGRLHHKTALRREGYLNRLTKRLATEYTLIAVEDLNISGMSRSAKGTVENPGKNVAAKSGLNRVVLDAAFGIFVRQLEYKAQWYGSKVCKVDRFYPSSKTCSECGEVKLKLSLSERVFRCQNCEYEDDRDFNAARNIRNEALRSNPQLASEIGESLNGRGDQRTLRGLEDFEASRPIAPG